MQTIFTLLLRVVLLVGGLLFAASLLLVVVLLVLAWGLSAAWARLLGRPVAPFVMRVHPREGFSQVFRARQGMPRTGGSRGPEAPQRRDQPADVVDVEAKQVRD